MGGGSNIVIILTIAMSDVISIMERIHKIPTFCKKPCGRNFYTKRNIGTMDRFKFVTFQEDKNN